MKQLFNILRKGAAVLVAAALLTINASAASYSPLYSAVVRDDIPANWWGTGIGYPRILQIQHSSRGDNNVLLATFEEAKAGLGPGKPGYPIYRSEDLGKTWSYVTTVYDPVNTSAQQAEWQPFLYELPKDLGMLKKGTILLVGCSIDAAHSVASCLQLYASTDGGRSFTFLSTIATGGGTESGVWEPFLLMIDGELICYYSDSTEYTEHSQKLVYRTSSDGITWSSTVDMIAANDPNDRPGMAVVTQLGDGRYFMVYEWVNNVTGGGNPICCKYSENGKDWGDITSKGTIIASTNGETLGSAPYCIWSPQGGRKGTLFVCGTFMRTGSSTTGTDYFVSYDYGVTWTTVDHPIPYEGGYSHVGYSSPMALSADGKLLFALNNPIDPNGKTPTSGQSARSCIKFAVVELVKGAASLAENQPGYTPTTTSKMPTTSTTTTTQKQTTTTITKPVPDTTTTASKNSISTSTTDAVRSTTTEATVTTITATQPTVSDTVVTTTSTARTSQTVFVSVWSSSLMYIGITLILLGAGASAVIVILHMRKQK